MVMTRALGGAVIALLSVVPMPAVLGQTLCGGSSCESCDWGYSSLVAREGVPTGCSQGTCPAGGCAEAAALASCENMVGCVEGSATIPSTVTAVGVGAFYGNTELTTLTWPASVTMIEREAFNGCSNLLGVNLEKSSVVVTIKRGAL
jgi:hypothetical protein